MLSQFDIKKWTRLVHNQVPIYVHAEKPDWFVPNRAGDRLLSSLAKDENTCLETASKRFLQRLPESTSSVYPGRAALLSTQTLHEMWFHITNRCNQTCKHCLFACSSTPQQELSSQRILSIAHQARELGCRIFTLTGGEPFMHPEYVSIVRELLDVPDTHVAVLTNGTMLEQYGNLLSRFSPDRLHLQISMDGLQERHEAIRGKGSFDQLCSQLGFLQSKRFPYTISMSVNTDNIQDMPGVVDLAARFGCTSIHFMWHFVRGRGESHPLPDPESIFAQTQKADQEARRLGCGIDNLDSLSAQVFAPSGTIHDGGNAAWESLAVGPDDRLYPSPALTGIDELATALDDNLADAWRDSPVMKRARQTSAKDMPGALRFIVGPGDPDYSYIHGGEFIGKDPYLPLYERLALWLIAREVESVNNEGPPRLLHKMGDRLESCGAKAKVGLVHSNCLLSFAQTDSRSVVKEFYRDAARLPREDILNPVVYPEELIEHVPKQARVRTYGCGSPVLDANLQPGDRVVDLGSGSGVECFIAAKLVGDQGRVTGIDMLDPMLELAEQSAKPVGNRLGYQNIEFKRGYLESLPLESESFDAVISNCVINLSSNKRRTFSEIHRVLRPGGRLVVSDVVTESEPDATIRNDEILRGECIAGAMTQRDLFGTLEESGFVAARVINQFPYRVVHDHPFLSLTYEAYKPTADVTQVRVMYRGPFSALVLREGKLLPRGVTCIVPQEDVLGCGEDVYIFGPDHIPINAATQSCCSCNLEPENRNSSESAARYMVGCMVCKALVEYLTEPVEASCHYCGKLMLAQAYCKQGHFVCDACHVKDGLIAIEQFCLETRETDLIKAFSLIRRHPSIPIHGPEHHAIIPGITLAACRNLGGPVDDQMIQNGIRRGANVDGGYCAFMGACGAAIGAGIALSLVLDANPLKPKERQLSQIVVQKVLQEVSLHRAARCCQRDCVIILKKLAELSESLFPVKLHADYQLVCKQHQVNQECMGVGCPIQRAGS